MQNNIYSLSNQQEWIVSEIVEIANNAISTNQQNNIIVDAVTGSGKTLMMTHAISRILNRNKSQKIAIIVATPSLADLHEQIYKKMEKYTNSFASSDRFMFKLIQSPSKSKLCESKPEIQITNHEVLIIGKSSFTKSGLYKTTGAYNKFIDDLKDYKVLYFRDEAHYGIKEKNSQDFNNFEKNIQELSIFNCFLSATPDMNNDIHKISLTARDLEDDRIKLLKSKRCEPIKYEIENDKISDEILLEKAIIKFQEIKKEYQQNNITFNPAMLIQINNDADLKKDPEKHKEFNEQLINIVNILKNTSEPKNSLKYYITFDTDANIAKSNTRYEKLSFDDLSQMDSDVDVIIFKVGAAIGWDIPRANMLVQLRKVNSENLQTQTLGRIMRYPCPHRRELYNISCLDEYYIFSNVLVKDVERFVYRVKNKFKEEKNKFLISEISNKEQIIQTTNKTNDDIRNSLQNILINNKDKYYKELVELFSNNKILITKNISKTNKEYIEKVIHNKLELKIYNDELAIKHWKVFKIIDELDTFYKNLNWEYDWEQFRYFIYKTFLDSIQKEFYTAKINNLPVYKNLDMEFSKFQYEEIIDEKRKMFITEIAPIDDYYLFEVLSNKKNHIYLDSINEVAVFKKLKEFINKNKAKIRIKTIFKNPLNSGIGRIEYIGEDSEIHIEHVDFVLSFFTKDNINKNLYIEVKGGERTSNQLSLSDYSNNQNLSKNTDDYNEEKTKSIMDAFKIITAQDNNNFYLSIAFVDSKMGKNKKSENSIRMSVNKDNNNEHMLTDYLKEILFS